MIKFKHISRIDQESKKSHGWYVRVRGNGETKSKFFSDRKNGGRAAAQLAAYTWREDVIKQFGDSYRSRAASAANNTGVTGVTFSEKKNCYRVTWVYANGRPGRTTVSVNKYGKEGAFKRACKIRKERQWSEKNEVYQ